MSKKKRKCRGIGNPPKRRGESEEDYIVRVAEEDGNGVCTVCEQVLILPGGYAGTDMCGPCATGDSSTMGEIGETW